MSARFRSRIAAAAAIGIGPACIFAIALVIALQGSEVTEADRADVNRTGAPRSVERAVHRPFEVTDRLIVRLRDAAVDGDAAARDAALAAQAPLRHVRSTHDGARVLRLPRMLNAADVRAIARRLARDPRVVHAEPDYRLRSTTVDDPYFAFQWSIGPLGTNAWGIDAPAAWAAGYTGTGVTVAILDTGVLPHRDLANRLLPGYDFVSADAPNGLPGGIYATANDGNGRDADASDPGNWIEATEKGIGPFADCPETGPTPTLRPSDWHGTRMAGIVAASANNGYGIAGIAPDAQILPVRVMGKCGGYLADINDGMVWANGYSVPGAPANPNFATVMLLAMEAQLPNPTDACPTALMTALATVADLSGGTLRPAVIIGALGNGGRPNVDPGVFDGLIPAACLPGRGLSAIATTRTGDLAPYSNALAGRPSNPWVVAAPGGHVPAGTQPADPAAQDGILSLWNTGVRGPVADDFAFLTGTSEAAAHVAGVAALLRQKRGITDAATRGTLSGRVTPFPATSRCKTNATPTVFCGEGIVNAAYAVAGIPPTPPTAVPTAVVAVSAAVAPASNEGTTASSSSPGTGGGGGGCTVGDGGRPDMLLPLLLVLACVRLRRRQAAGMAMVMAALTFAEPGSAQPRAADETAPVPVAVIETGAHAGPIVAWDVQGNRLVTAGVDKTVRLWALPTLRPITVIRPPQGAADDGLPVSVALHPEQRRIAVLVRRRDAASGTPPMAIYEYALPSLELVTPLAVRRDETVGAIAYGRDGVLVTAPQRVQAEIAPFGDAGEVHFFDTGALHVLDAAGRNVASVESSAFDIAPASLRVGRDGRFVAFADQRDPAQSIGFGVDPATFVDAEQVPTVAPTAAAARLGARVTVEADRLVLDGRPLALPPDAVATRVEIAPDGQRIYAGTNRGVHAFDAVGRALWFRPLESPVRALATSAGGETLVAALADGTLRWTRAQDGGPLLSLFVNRTNREWVLWNPNGYFTSSPFGDRHLGWLRSPDDRTAEYVGSEQLERVLYRPDFVGCTVRCLGDAKPAFGALGQPVIMAAFSQFAPPKVRIVSVTREGERRHRVRFVAEAGRLPMLDWGVFANGIPVVPLVERRLADGPALRLEREVLVDTADALTTIRIEAFNGRSMGRAETVVETRGAAPVARPKGDLYLLAVGINRFADLPEEMQLLYSATDASTVARFLGQRHARRFDKVHVRVIADGGAEAPTKENVLAALDFFAPAGANDTVVLFLASHAVSDRAGNYFFIPADARADDLVLLEQGKVAGEASAIAWTRLVDGLRVAAGRRLMIVDTCHAEAIRGKVDLGSLAKRSAAAHFAILTASRSDELAMELDSARHGLFTYALLRGLFSEGDLDGDGRITLGELHRYVVPTVERLRPDPKLSQTPQLVAPTVLLDHALGDLRRAVGP